MVCLVAKYLSLKPLLENGRSFHTTWVQQAFAPQLSANPELLDPLYTLTDLFTWKLLRLERGLTREKTEKVMMGMITAVLEFTTDYLAGASFGLIVRWMEQGMVYSPTVMGRVYMNSP